MSAVASSSSTPVNGAATNGSLNYNKSKRRSGTFRVVAEDFSQFTLEDEFDEDFHQVLMNCERYATPVSEPVLDEPLIDRSSNNSSPKKTLNKDTSRTSLASHSNREISRLTDEVEVDGDSASDELDLLPPLPPCTGRKFPKWKIKWPNWLICCNSRVPMKCTIM